MQKIKNRNIILVFIPIAFGFHIHAQKDAQHIYEGNALFYGGKIPQSSLLYSKALEANPNNRKANFNLGASLYKNAELIKSGQMQMPTGSKITPDSMSKIIYDQAAQNFAVVANSVSNKDTLHQTWHNIGNCYLKKKDYQQAITAYKKSLKYNPKDEETRYNLAYALKNLPKDQQKQNQKQQQQNKKEQDKKHEQKNSQPKEAKLNKEQAEQLLKALMDQEKKLQDKRKAKAEDNNKETEKDW